ncbi:MAG TPA: hypothetical protein VKK79_09675, partial [Candidatus Lokiarchaeia archaeon]|nr:hypothetical protein [Candidatus Lokiarchaeia archaeon]
VLFIPICLITRSIVQTMSSSFIKIPANPERRFIPSLAGFAACMGILGCIVLAFPSIGLVGLVIFLLTLIFLGFVGGVGYAASVAKIIRDSARSDARLFNGLSETTNGAASLIGMLMSGAVTGVAGFYYMPYFITLGLLIIAIFIVVAFGEKKKNSD